jgi:hypothetical protein
MKERRKDGRGVKGVADFFGTIKQPEYILRRLA